MTDDRAKMLSVLRKMNHLVSQLTSSDRRAIQTQIDSILYDERTYESLEALKTDMRVLIARLDDRPINDVGSQVGFTSTKVN